MKTAVIVLSGIILLGALFFRSPVVARSVAVAQPLNACQQLAGTWEQYLYNDRPGTDTIRLNISNISAELQDRPDRAGGLGDVREELAEGIAHCEDVGSHLSAASA